jgi:TrpR-related protein YerC/YecD
MEYKPKFASEDTELLFDAIKSLETKDEYYRFFEDLCTVSEILALSQRFHIAKLLTEHHTYQEIEETTKASTATISRINRFVKYGSEGYMTAIERLKDK